MNPDVKSDWVAALRSGEYHQGRNALHRKTSDGPDRMCCLGVLCELAVQNGVGMDVRVENRPYDDPGKVVYDDYGSFPPPSIGEWAGLDVPEDDSYNVWVPFAAIPVRLKRKFADIYVTTPEKIDVSSLNDNGATFDEIADLVEAYA